MRNPASRARHDNFQTARAGAVGQEAKLLVFLPPALLARFVAEERGLALSAFDVGHLPAGAAGAGRAVVLRHD